VRALDVRFGILRHEIMDTTKYDRAVVAWDLADDVGLESLKQATVEYFLNVGGHPQRRIGVFGFTFEEGAGPTELPVLRVSHPHSEGCDPLRDLVLVFHRDAAPTIEVHPDQAVARFLVRTPLTVVRKP
jgi:hypothetical protein